MKSVSTVGIDTNSTQVKKKYIKENAPKHIHLGESIHTTSTSARSWWTFSKTICYTHNWIEFNLMRKSGIKFNFLETLFVRAAVETNFDMDFLRLWFLVLFLYVCFQMLISTVELSMKNLRKFRIRCLVVCNAMLIFYSLSLVPSIILHSHSSSLLSIIVVFLCIYRYV